MLLILAGAAWAGLAGAVAVVVGRSIRHADQRDAAARAYVRQLDAPLWRGTDMPDPDGPTATENPGGAILALSMATDETSARYWLAMCARRGIEQPTLDELWRQWVIEHSRRVQFLHTDNGDDQ
jgi:hypothetical protein